MDKEIERLSSVLSLAERESGNIVIPEDAWGSPDDKNSLKLVGRVFTKKTVQFESFSTIMKRAINAVMGMEIERLSEDKFIMTFNHTLDKQTVLDNTPWNFDKSPLILSPIEEDEDPTQVNLDWCEFYVHAHGIPLGRRTKEMAAFIGSRIGKFKDVDFEKSSKTRPDTLRMKVAINMLTPLPRFLKLMTPSNKELLITFTYESLSNFCFLCGICDHVDRFCKLRYAPGFVNPKSDFPFGAWLKETPISRSLND